ncbi:hypothetical protein CLV63_108204 [Murinocardiopsis flavida]|uniref:DNA-directed RNA polymerase specialized sigma24 family protein n=1 Tax=Murinocardiopsis flavida TaxID=645275 RepID=A0A2P8DJT8_9ACTN|nr:hypothetical protein [Murinocardiopsis flavida]PSK97483.1 hypothetical protein CLV63_108204 [Murinocardiopsis flavida]
MFETRVIPPGLLGAYRSLVRIAYLVLPGSRRDQQRLYQAHRVVAEALPGREAELSESAYAEVRLTVLRRALSPRRRVRSRPSWVRMLPAIGFGDDVALFGALDELAPETRAAYALAFLERLEPSVVRDLLVECGVGEPATAITEAAALGRRLEMSKEHQERLLDRPPFDPTIVRVYARPTTAHRGRRVAAAGAALVLCAGALLVVGRYGGGFDAAPAARADGATDARSVPAGTWRERFRLDLGAWNARGGLRGDDALVRRALKAWGDAPASRAHGGASDAPPMGEPHLLFAGEVDGSDVVVLYEEPRVVRYIERGDTRRADIHPAPGAGAANWPALRLTEGADGVRYLLPPWVTSAATAELADSAPDWAELATEGGVTEPVRPNGGAKCAVDSVLRLRAPGVAHGQPYTAVDTGSFATAHIGAMPPPPAEIRRLGPHELTDEASFQLWSKIGCRTGIPDESVETATAWEFAEGELPGGGRARWVCTRLGYADGDGRARMTLLATTGDGTEAVDVGTRDNGWDCSNLGRRIAGGTWWRADSGRWHYVAAASRDALVIRASGGADGEEEGQTLAIAGPKDGDRPGAAVELAATGPDGEPMTVFGTGG